MSAGEALVRAGLSGAWQLVSCTMTHPDGRIEHPFGLEPRGLIAYTADGWMACQMAGEPAGHSAYFGPVSVDEDGATVIHHVQGASHSRLSGDQLRRYRVSGDELLLSAQSGDSLVEVLWRRPLSRGESRSVVG